MKISYNDDAAQIEITHMGDMLQSLPCARPSGALMREVKKRFANMSIQIPHDAPVDHCRDYASGFMRVTARFVGVV